MIFESMRNNFKSQNKKVKDELDIEVDQMLELAASGKFEPGIYNFCDRWCERCEDTAKCYLFAEDELQKGKKLLAGQTNEDSDSWMKDIHHSFEVTGRLLERQFAEHGIDMAEVVKEFGDVKSWDDGAEKKYKSLPASKLSRQYMKECHEFLNKFHDNRLEYLPTLGMEIDYSDVRDEIEIISWYSTMLPTKIWRYYYDREACRREEDNELKEMMLADLPKTFALVEKCLNRSLLAWNGLRGKRDDLKLEAKKFIALLNKIKRSI